MATTTSNVFIPELVADAVKGFVAAGKKGFLGSGGGSLRMGMPSRESGTSVRVPYFGSIGEFTDLADGVASTPVTFGETAETATVTRSSLSFDITKWASASAAGDIDAEIARQMYESLQRKIDLTLLNTAIDETTAPYNAATYIQSDSANMSYDVFINGRSKLGDEAEDFAAFICHSRTYADLLKEKDTQGRPLLIPAASSADKPTYLGIPVIESDRMPFVAGTPNTTTSALVKKDALVFWMADISEDDILQDMDILAHSNIGAMHIYFACHRYIRMGGQSKPGVVLYKHEAS